MSLTLSCVQQICSRWLWKYVGKHTEKLYKYMHNYWKELKTLRRNCLFWTISVCFTMFSNVGCCRGFIKSLYICWKALTVDVNPKLYIYRTFFHILISFEYPVVCIQKTYFNEIMFLSTNNIAFNPVFTLFHILKIFSRQTLKIQTKIWLIY